MRATDHAALPRRELPPARLLEAARAGDQAAWAALVHRYAGAIRGATRRFGLSPADAEDVEQTTWLRLVEHAGVLRRPEAVAGWLATTARRECMRLQTARLREVLVEPGELPEQPEPAVHDEALIARERATALRRSLESLSPRQRAVAELLLREPEPSYAEIADALGIPLNSVGPTRSRCLHQLRMHGALASLG